MEAYNKFKHFLSTVSADRASLEHEKDTLLRQKEVFQNELEAAQLMKDRSRMDKANQGLSIINKELESIEAELRDLDIIPYAQAVFDEGEAYLNSLVHELQDQFVKVYEARDLFIKEIKKLAVIRGKSCDVRNWTSEAGPYLRRNPLDPLPVREFHRFAVDLKLLQSILA